MPSVTQFGIGIGIVLAGWLAGELAAFALKRLERFSSKTRTELDDELIASLRGPVRFGIFLGALYAALTYLGFSFGFGVVTLESVFKVLFTLLAAHVLVKLLNTFVGWYMRKVSPKTQTDLDDQIVPLIRFTSRIAIYVIAGMMVLDAFGIEIGPLLAGLGIAGLAVAMALQDTLSNFFASIHIALDQPVKKGDMIQLESGDIGEVLEVGWRSSRIRMITDNLVIVPNSKLANSVIVNFNRPKPLMSVIVECGVSYDTDLGSAERVVLGVARRVCRKYDIKQEPLVRFFRFGESSVDFRVILKARHYIDQFEISHEFIKALHKEFAKRGIEIPFPQRDVHLKGSA